MGFFSELRYQRELNKNRKMIEAAAKDGYYQVIQCPKCKSKAYINPPNEMLGVRASCSCLDCDYVKQYSNAEYEKLKAEGIIRI